MKDVIWVMPEHELEKQREWIISEVASIGDSVVDALVERAKMVRTNAYPEYSNYYVGAAVLATGGAIYAGCNSEVASYSETTHAEQNAVGRAIAEGEVAKQGRTFIRAIAVVHETGTSPCGRCRQILIEHCDNALVILANADGVVHRITSLRMLLPHAFTPEHLGRYV